MDTVYAEYKELSREDKKYFKYTQSHKFKLELSKFTKMDENSDWSYNFKTSDFVDEETDDVVCKCILLWENRITQIESEYIIDECPLINVKKWFISKVDKVIDLASDGWSLEMTIEYVDAYLKAIADIELNTIIILEDGFHIECLTVPRQKVE